MSDGKTDDKAVAAVLLVAVRYGSIGIEKVVARIDEDIVSQAAPETWLLDASLARSEEDLRGVLSEHAAEHPIVGDPFARLDVLAAMRAHHGVAYHAVARLVLDLWSDGRMPADLHELADDVYEDAFCAHDYDGVPQPARAEQAASAFLSAASGRSEWSRVIADVVSKGWV